MGIGKKNKVAPEDEQELTEKEKFGKPKKTWCVLLIVECVCNNR